MDVKSGWMDIKSMADESGQKRIATPKIYQVQFQSKRIVERVDAEQMKQMYDACLT